MPFPKDAARLCRDNASTIVAAAISLLAATLLFTRYSIDDRLTRDRAIYAYAGQRMAHGVPPYTSIFDPKTPVSAMLSGITASIARATGQSQLTFIRLAFFGISLLLVMAMFILALRLWHSRVGAVVAAIMFACFNLVASEAIAGPEAKTPGILAAIVTMWLVIEKRWYWAAFASSVAVLTWQPFVIYPFMLVVIVVWDSIRERRWEPVIRTVAGLLTPFVAVVTYFAVTGGLANFWRTAFVFPATGIPRRPFVLHDRIDFIRFVVRTAYGFSGHVLWWGDLILIALVVFHLVRGRHKLGAAIRHPLFSMVFVTMIAMLGYAVYDFQGPPDILPFLPYPPLGFAGLIFLLQTSFSAVTIRRVISATAIVAIAALFGASMVWFHRDEKDLTGLRSQQADACAIDRIIGNGANGGLWSLGDPIPLVITSRVNPDRYVYLGESVDRWKVKHTAGGFDGWTRQIQANDPAVVVLQNWFRSGYPAKMTAWLKSDGYRSAYAGKWHLFLRPATIARAEQAGVRLTSSPTPFATGLQGSQLPVAGTSACTS